MKVDRWAQALEISPQVVEIPADLDPAKDIYPLEETMDSSAGQVGPLLQNVQEVSDQAHQATGIPEEPGIISPAGLEPATLAGLRLAYLTPEWLPRENLLRLEQALEHMHQRPDSIGTGGDPDPGPGSGAGHGSGGLLDRALKGPSSSRFPCRRRPPAP